MSQENVDLILSVQPAGNVDLVQLHRNDEAWAAWMRWHLVVTGVE